MKTNWKIIRTFIRKHKSQSHLAVCSDLIFDNVIKNGVYAFPHSGSSRKKSFWRAIASLYSIGTNDLIFIYRMNGTNDGCKELHGPFKIHVIDKEPCLYYDAESPSFPLKVGKTNNADCQSRFLIGKMLDNLISIGDNFELVKKFETKKIWGYRHPAVMNIGAARKKSVTSLSYNQTLTLIDLLEQFGEIRRNLTALTIPNKKSVDYYKNLSIDQTHFRLNDNFILNNYAKDEAFYYAYFIRALKHKNCQFRRQLLSEFWNINKDILLPLGIENYENIVENVMMEVIVTVHLQDELDVISTNLDDSVLMFYEFKKGEITQESITQSEKYIDLLEVVFPEKKILANVIGVGKKPNIFVSKKYQNRMKLVSIGINQTKPLLISFQET